MAEVGRFECYPGGLYDNVRDRVAGPGHEGYGALATSHDGDDWDRYEDAEDRFFGEHIQEKPKTTSASSSAANTGASSTGTSGATAPNNSSKNKDSWDEWQDF